MDMHVNQPIYKFRPPGLYRANLLELIMNSCTFLKRSSFSSMCCDRHADRVIKLRGKYVDRASACLVQLKKKGRELSRAPH